jgi:hypothetical protein
MWKVVGRKILDQLECFDVFKILIVKDGETDEADTG